MQAVVFDKHSPALDAYHLVDDFPIPHPGAGEVLIKVAYTALNRLDNWVRVGWKSLELAFPHVPCSDFSGVIVSLGEGVQGWTIGQRVTANPLLWCGECPSCRRGEHNRCRTAQLIGEHVRGACAEYVVAPAHNLIAIPADFSLAEAAAASLVFVTAWHSLIVAAELRAGELVLIVGAGGGVNTAGLQIGKLAGATVYVVASNAAKAERAYTLGADWVHDRTREPDWAAAVHAKTQREGVDLVFDNVGQATWMGSLRCLRPGGRLATVGGTSGYQAQTPVNLIFGKQLRIIGSTMGTQGDYGKVMSLVFGRRLLPIVDSIFPMSQFRTAMTRMLADEMFGKILIAIDDQEKLAGKLF